MKKYFNHFIAGLLIICLLCLFIGYATASIDCHKGDTFSLSGIAEILTTVENDGCNFQQFANQMEIAYTLLPAYSEFSRHGANAQSAETTTMYKNAFTRSNGIDKIKGERGAIGICSNEVAYFKIM